MLPYDVDQHARRIFRGLVAQAGLELLSRSPRDVEGLAETSVRGAMEFAAQIKHLPGQPAAKPPSDQPFAELVDEWQRRALTGREARERPRILNRLKRYVLPKLGQRPISSIQPAEIVAVLRAVEDAGFRPLAHLILREVNRIFRYGIAIGALTHNPAAEVRHALFRRQAKRRATILLPTRIAELLRAIDDYEGYSTAKYMLRLLPYVFVRPSELRMAEWLEIDFKAAQWRIPARRMKARRPHVVPLSRQALSILRTVRGKTRHQPKVFASQRSADGFISEHMFYAMLRKIGFAGEIAASGFRSMAATLLSEQGWNADAIERQLSHADADPLRRVYNFAQYLPERKRMMQGWADHLDGLRDKA